MKVNIEDLRINQKVKIINTKDRKRTGDWVNDEGIVKRIDDVHKVQFIEVLVVDPDDKRKATVRLFLDEIQII